VNFPVIRAFNEFCEMGQDVFSPSIFLENCNLRCPYCMNAKLVLGKIDKIISIETIKQYVIENRSEWLMISGGEPTISNEEHLLNLLNEIKSWNCKIGMSTNGTLPNKLKSILPNLNYVALDIKSSSNDIYKAIGSLDGFTNAITSKSILNEARQKRQDFDYEIRTTLYSPFIDINNLKEIASVMKKDERWVLQQYRLAKNMLDASANNVMPYDNDNLNEFLSIAKQFVDDVSIRYV